VGGYFIGTTYDGQKVFDLLRKKAKGSACTFMKNGAKIAEIVKDYDADTFPDTEESLGYPILVYQETINQVIPEYLVNFNYLVHMMDTYGFKLADGADVLKMGMPSATGTFDELFHTMVQEVRRKEKLGQGNDYGTAAEMSDHEKKISFLNRYFIFKKVHTVNTENLGKIVQTRVRAVPPPPAAAAVPPEKRSKKLNTKMVLECPTETA
jgi:hypothetical protein